MLWDYFSFQTIFIWIFPQVSVFYVKASLRILQKNKQEALRDFFFNICGDLEVTAILSIIGVVKPQQRLFIFYIKVFSYSYTVWTLLIISYAIFPQIFRM